MGALVHCCYLSHGKCYCWMDLNVRQAEEVLTTGKVVVHGRWYWSA